MPLTTPIAAPVGRRGLWRGRWARRGGLAVAIVGLAAVPVGVSAGGTAGATQSKAASASTTVDLSGVTVNFGDQVKYYQTVAQGGNALQGAPYSVSWSNFLGGPPVVTAETGGSVDVGFMAETPTIFAQAAGDPIKVIGVQQGVPGSPSPFAIMVPSGSSIKKISQLKGKTVAVDEGTVSQYALVKILQKGGLSYKSVQVDNLSLPAVAAALESGRVDAAALDEPFISQIEAAHKGTVLASGEGVTTYLNYLVASQSALSNPKKAAAIVDLAARLYKAAAQLQKNPQLAAETYVKTYGVTMAEAESVVKSARVTLTPINPAVIRYQQQEANTFAQLGLIPNKINVSKAFSLSVNRQVMAAVAGK